MYHDSYTYVLFPAVEVIRVWEPLYHAVVHSGNMSVVSFIKCSQAGEQKIPKSQCWFLLVLAKG